MRVTSFLVGIALLAGGCGGDIQPSHDHSMVGVWIEWEGNYRIEVHPDGKYRFCERSECFDGNFEAPNGKAEWLVNLEHFNEKPIGRKFILKYKASPQEDDFLQLNIQKASLQYPKIMDRCVRPLCISIGDDSNIHEPLAGFSKMGNL